MAVPGFILVVCILLLHISSVTNYPNGKVTNSCHGMLPIHGHNPLPDPVHNIAVSQATFRPGDQIKVTLSGPPFKGFLLEARNAEDLNGPPIGSFTLIDSQEAQLLTCEDVQGSAVSHTSPSKKTEIKVDWNAPSSAPNHIQFLATVVEKYKIYWVKIPGPVISQPDAPPFTTPEATRLPLSTSAPVSHLTESFNASDCGKKKFCIRSPLNCDPKKDHTCLFLSFTRDDQSVKIEMSGPSEGYLSFAFSHDRWMLPRVCRLHGKAWQATRDAFDMPNTVTIVTMETLLGLLEKIEEQRKDSGDDDAYMCIRGDQTVHLKPSHLTGREHPIMDSEVSLEDMAWRLADGFMQCSFRRNITLPGFKNRFDLNASYYIFLANGATADGRIHKHSQQPLITHEKYNVTDHPKNVGGSHSVLLLKAHGALMFVAWMTTVSIGVLTARFFKPVWSQIFFGKAVWFQPVQSRHKMNFKIETALQRAQGLCPDQVHRLLMITTSALTCIAVILPFIYRGGWSWHAGYHPYLGCVVMVLAVLQPLLATFRPPLQHPRRQVFNWTHWSIGTAARIIAVTTIFLGMDLSGLNLPDPWTTYTMIGFVAWHVGTEIILEIHAYRLSQKAVLIIYYFWLCAQGSLLVGLRRPYGVLGIIRALDAADPSTLLPLLSVCDSNDYPLYAEILDDTRIQIMQSFTVAEAEGHAFKKFVLAIYICGNVTFLIIFLSAINYL